MFRIGDLIQKPVVAGLMVFAALVTLTQVVTYQDYLIYKNGRIREINNAANVAREKMRSALSYSFGATKTLSFIYTEYGITDFEKVAKEILASNRYIDALELVENGTITHVYPLEGNESAIGYNILNDSLRNKEAFMAIDKKQLYFAGPFKLKQGGMAVVGRLPIFYGKHFVGFSVVLIKLSTIIKAAGLDTTMNSTYVYQLSKVNPDTKAEEFFLPENDVFKTGHVASVDIPEGHWKIYVAHVPVKGLFFAPGPVSIIGLMLSFLGGLFAWYIARQPEELKRLVDEKTLMLGKSEENYRSTIERVSDGFVALDNSWRFNYANAKAGEILGRNAPEMIGKLLWDEFPGQAGTAFQHAYQQAMEEQKYVYVESFYEPYGRWFENHIYPSPNGLSIFFRDVTEKKKSEAAIMSEKKLSESIINSLPGVFYYYAQNGKFIRWNKNFELVSNYSGSEVVDMHPLDFFDDDEKGLLRERIREVFIKGSAEVEANLLTKDKRKLPYYFNGHLVYYEGAPYLIGMGIDITARKKAETALLHEMALSESVINSLPGIFYLADINGQLQRWNKNFETVSGYSAEELKGKRVIEFVAMQDRENLMAGKQATLEKGTAELEALFLTKAGETRPYYFTSILSQYNNAPCLLGIGIDISELKKAQAAKQESEEQLKKSYEDIRRLNEHLQTIREEERGSIAREIHDELGQQLTGLKMDISWLDKKLPADEKMLHDKAASIKALIDETVVTVRRIATQLRPGILDDLGLEAAIEWQSNEFEKRTGITCKFASKVNGEIDKSLNTGIFRIYQEALTNIIRHANATMVEVFLGQDINGVIFTIKDNGKGFRADAVKGKKTLGLIGMQERARMLNGELTMESEEGKGTTITLVVKNKS